MEFMMTNKNSIQNLIFLKIWLFIDKVDIYHSLSKECYATF